MVDEQPLALVEGRRVYIGNLLYAVKPSEVESMLQENGFDRVEHIHISIDPISARNPGYCFVDFEDLETAQGAIASLQATIRGRPVKVGPCRPKTRDRRGHAQTTPIFERWGNWNSQRRDERRRENPNAQSEPEHGPEAALDHFDDQLDDDGRRRIWVGGLPKVIDQEQNQRDLQTILKKFQPVAIGKRITPHQSTRGKRGHHHFCFVDFKTVEEAKAAVKELNGQMAPWGPVLVQHTSNIPSNLEGRSTRYTDSADMGEPARKSQYSRNSSSRAMASSNWRRVETE